MAFLSVRGARLVRNTDGHGRSRPRCLWLGEFLKLALLGLALAGLFYGALVIGCGEEMPNAKCQTPNAGARP